MAQNNSVKIYLVVTQYIYLLIVLTLGGYFLGYYLGNKNSIIGGIVATVGAICGIILFIVELLRIGKENENKERNR